MDFHKLPRTLFDGEGPYLACADSFIHKQRSEFPGIAESHPDIIMEGHPIANQYWYMCHEGSNKHM